MFGGSFGRGFITEFSKAVDRGVRDDMERMKDDTSRLAKVRFERGVREQERYEEDMKSNLDNIKDMSRKVGSADAVQFLIDRHGFAEAQNIANTLYQTKQKKLGDFDIPSAIGLEQRKGASITAKQLAEFVTPPMKIPEITGGDDVAGGFMRLFGAEPTDEIKRRSDALLSAQGIPTDMKTSTVDMPEVLGGRGIREWEIYQPDDAAQAYKKLAPLAQQKLQEAMDTGNEELKSEAYEIMAVANLRLDEATALQNIGKPRTQSEVARSTSITTAFLASLNGVAKQGGYQDDVYTDQGMATGQFTTLSTAADTLELVANEALNKGMSPQAVSNAKRKAARENRILIFKPVSDELRGFGDGGTFAYGEVDSLIPNRNKIFPASPVNNPPPPGSANNAVIQPSQVTAAMSTQKAAYKTASTSQKQGIINRLTQTLNPATGTNFTSQEAQDYLES